jgi:hypothetical protein
MATSSKYVQLTSSVLMEYIYADNSQVNVSGNPFRISTSAAPIWKMSNTHTNIDQILNSDSSEIILNGSPSGTGNVRNRSFAQLESYKTALLDIDKVVPYNDYDPKLTPTTSLPIVFANTQAPIYDTIRLHLVQGFNFEQNDGLTLTLKIKKRDGKGLLLSNFVYNRSDTFENLNPSPFFFGGRVYDTYVEIRVLSTYWLSYDYWLGTLNGDTVVEKITGGIGVERDQQIQVYFSWVKSYTTIDEQAYGTILDTVAVDLPLRDQFETISAYIDESPNADYVEFYAKYNSAIIEQFINDLNQSGYDYILLHDLIQSEYIYDTSSSQYAWVKTNELQISQTSDYDLPNVYRPIIKNPSATAYKIDYVVRLYNKSDNTQVWKAASLISYETQKYGRKIGSINLGTNPVKSIIYNKNYVKEIKINKISEPVLGNTKYITSFIDATEISVSFDTVNLDSNVQGNTNTLKNINNPSIQNSASTGNIYTNGLARILIPDSVAFLKFVIYQKNAQGINSPLNLSGIGDINLTFTDNTGDKIEILEYPTNYTSKTRGEIVYRINEAESKNILNLSNRNFNLYLINDKGDKTFLYNGNFYSPTQWMDLQSNNKIVDLEYQIEKLTADNNNNLSTIQNQSSSITDLSEQIKNLTNKLGSITGENINDDATIATQQETIISLQSTLNSNQQIISDLNTQIVNLTSQLSLNQSQILQDQGMVTQLQNQLAGQIKLNTYTPISNAIIKPSTSFFEKEINKVRANIRNTKISYNKSFYYRGEDGRMTNGFTGYNYGGGGQQS